MKIICSPCVFVYRPLLFSLAIVSFTAMSFSAMSFSAMSFSAMSFSAMSFSALSFSAMSFSAMSLSAWPWSRDAAGASARLPTASTAFLALPCARGPLVRVSVVADVDSSDGPQPGLVLVTVPAASAWAVAGLKDGDVVIRIDGEEIGDLSRVLHLLTSGTEHSLLFVRGPGPPQAIHLALDPACSTSEACPRLQPSLVVNP